MMPEIYNKKAIQRLIDHAVPGERLPNLLRWALGFDYPSSPQGQLYWKNKSSGYAKWAKKDTKYLMELLGLEEEEDIWL